MNTIATVKIHFARKISKIYLVNKDQQLTSNLTEFDNRLKILKLIKKSSPESEISKCHNYSNTQIAGFENSICHDRDSCIDLCVVKNYLLKHKSFPIVHSVLDKIMFEKYLLDKTYFNTSKDYEIEGVCLKNYSRIDCLDIKFISTLKDSYPYRTFTIELDIYFEKLRIKELEYNLYRFYLNILNIESILFGVNMHATLVLYFSMAKICFKIKWNRVYAFLFFLTCLMGFLGTIYVIFREIINNELVDNMYLRTNNDVKMPTLIFCLKFEESNIQIDKILNGKYLDELTSDLNYTSVFTDIKYYDVESRQIESYSFNNSDPNIRLNYFYYFNMKCLSVANEIIYKRQDLYFKNSSTVLKFYLDKKLANKHRKIYILYHRDNAINDENNRQFNEIYAFRIGKVDNHTIAEESDKHETNMSHEHSKVNDYDLFYKYRIRLEPFVIEVDDKFQLLKQPKMLLYKKEDLNNVSNYLRKMKHKFMEKYNLTTRVIPLLNGSRDFNSEVNEKLFEQFYYQVT